MILPAGAPLEPYGRPLRALYVSLNHPVVTVESLPPGPAAALVALHAEGASVCLRSIRSGQTGFFTTTEDLAGDRRVALDAALSFAESMGFLFDEDEVAVRGDAGPREAAALWGAHCGEGDELPGPAPGQEILLEEPLEQREEVPPALVLSKFRRAGAFEPELDAPPADVRLRLVSRF